MSKRRRLGWRAIPRWARIGVWSVAVLLTVVVAAAAVLYATLDPDSLKSRIVAAVKRETGRELTIAGPVGIAFALPPTLTVRDASLTNPPGFSRPQFATLQRLDLTLALLPLLHRRIEFDRLALVKPDILLERDAHGRTNWGFTREPDPAARPNVRQAPVRTGPPPPVSIAEFAIERGTLGWRDLAAHRSLEIGLTDFRARANAPGADTQISAHAVYSGIPITVSGETGPLARLVRPDAITPWPVHLALEARGARLTVDGTIAEPLRGRLYSVRLEGTAADLAALAPLLPATALPPLRNASVSAQLTDTGAPMPAVTNVTLHTGTWDLGAVVPGLRLDKADITAARIDQPVELSAQGSVHGVPAQLIASLGPSAALLRAQPIPIAFNLRAAGSSLAAKGSVALPAGQPPSLQLDVTANKLDADALSAAVAPPAPAATATSATAPHATLPATAGPPAERTIPFELLRRANADLRLTIAQLVSRGATYRDLAARLQLHDGRLRLDPASATLPEGRLEAVLTADATQAPPAVTLRLNAPALALQPLLATLHQPPYAAGNLELHADFSGAGATPRLLGASLTGTLSLGMANGTIDNRVLGSALGAILREANLLDLVGRGGTSAVQCFAARFTVKDGIAAASPLVLNSSLLTMDGQGTVNLQADTLDLHVRPQGRIGGTQLVVPLHVSGPISAPVVKPDPGSAVAANAGTLATLFGRGKLNGAEKLPAQPGRPDCTTVLAAARGHAAPKPAAASQSPATPKLPNAGALLKQLMR